MGLKPPVLVVGAGNHAMVVIDTLRLQGIYKPVVITDPSSTHQRKSILEVQVIGGDDQWGRVRRQGVAHSIVAVGDNHLREKLSLAVTDAGFELINAIHPSSVIAASARLHTGITVLAMVVVNPLAEICDGVILNTSCSVDHHCKIGPFAHIAPGARLAGSVNMGPRVLIGTGAVVVPGIRIGADALIGAGSVVIVDVQEGTRVAGNPASLLRKARKKK